jgi:lysophospholipase L1-like esterase
MAGTNDVNANINVTTAPDRLGSLLDECTASCPDAVVLVAQLTPIVGNASQTRADAFNAAIPGLVATRVEEGKKLLVVNMENYVTTAELPDGLHPDDDGYEGMAMGWYDGITEAAKKGWIGKPVGAVGGRSAVISGAVRERMGDGARMAGMVGLVWLVMLAGL